MATTTPLAWRGLMIYQVYVRNHTAEGTFRGVIDDLDRIKDLGTDVVYLLPINPIGEVDRKGTLGSPYAIKDYFAINPELGDDADFDALIKAVHARNLRLIIDVVFNHTAPDALLYQSYPEFYYRDSAGNPTNRVGDWTDIRDLDFTRDARLKGVFTDVLRHWTARGVDGFRFDVASFLPTDFLQEARKSVEELNPDTLWICESVHTDFLRAFRNRGFEALSEGELYQTFDIAYDYDTHPAFERYLNGEGTLDAYVKAILNQEGLYPQNYIKLRNLENHDYGRIATALKEDPVRLDNWHAFSFFLKGATMIYAGGEWCETKHPSLFEKDTIARRGRDISNLIKTCARLVKDPLFTHGAFDLKAESGILIGTYEDKDKHALGIFNIENTDATVTVPYPDGEHINQITRTPITITNGTLDVPKEPIILIRRKAR